MPSIQAKMISGLFKLIGVNKMLDKNGAEFEKLLESYKEKLLERDGICSGSPSGQARVF